MNPYTLLAGVKLGLAIVEVSVEVPQNLKIDLSYDLAIPLLSIYQDSKLA